MKGKIDTNKITPLSLRLEQTLQEIARELKILILRSKLLYNRKKQLQNTMHLTIQQIQKDLLTIPPTERSAWLQTQLQKLIKEINEESQKSFMIH